MIDEGDFANQVERLIKKELGAASFDELSWEHFHAPLLDMIQGIFVTGGKQDSTHPGKVRIDMGKLQPSGGLESNPDTILVIDFDWVEGDVERRFFAEYNLADELICYAEVGGEGWDIERQIAQLQKTIARLKAAAVDRGWPIAPDL